MSIGLSILRALLFIGVLFIICGLTFAWFLPLIMNLRSHDELAGRQIAIGRWRLPLRGMAGMLAVVGFFLLLLVAALSLSQESYARIAYVLLVFFGNAGLFFWLLHRSQGEVSSEERRQWRWWNPLRRYWPLGVRAQLMIGYTVVSGFLLLIFTGLFFVAATQLFHSSDPAFVAWQNDMHQISADPSNGVPTVNGQPLQNILKAGTPPSGSQQHADYQNAAIIRILDAQGNVVYYSPLFANLKVPASETLKSVKGKSFWETRVLTTDGQAIWVQSGPLVTSDNHVYGVLQVGSTQAPHDNPVSPLVQFIEQIALPLVWTLGIGGSYALAARAFRPIRKLTEAARRIGEDTRDLHQRVPLPAARDDVRNMAVTFNEMLERLDRSFTQQRRFVADASHELRTPVAAIRSMTDVALAQEEISTVTDYAAVLRDVNAEAERLGKLINALLSLARADEGKLHLDCDPVRVDLLSDDVVKSCAPLAEERGITLSAGTLEPATVNGDTARLIQAIISLVDNALTYTNLGGTVTVSVLRKDREALIAVADTGIGIDAKDLPHIFERFYRADPARSRVVGGSGLGLALVDGVVRAHNGTVGVTSTPGKGSTFTIALPLAEDIN
jgi:two-component system, OmpR family, sensor kinase